MESKAQEPAVPGSRAAISDASGGGALVNALVGALVATTFHAESMILASRLVNARLMASFTRAWIWGRSSLQDTNVEGPFQFCSHQLVLNGRYEFLPKEGGCGK